ncbi:MAG: hypothetical protein RR056_04800 [Acetivibrio sp.]
MSKRHMFPGGNTSQGFVNFFDGIFPNWEFKKKCYILKGGPGVGKNTFMKYIGQVAEEKDLDVEYFHCASDSTSFDGVRIPDLGIAVLDGTAPHTMDPIYPGAFDQIWNLGDFLQEKKLTEKKEEIVYYNEQNQFCYKKTFGYLRAAGALENISTDIYKKSLEDTKLQTHVEHLFLSPPKSVSSRISSFRKLFYSAFTPLGLIDYAPSLPAEDLIFYLDGPEPIGGIYLNLALKYALNHGYHGEIFYSPLLPDQPLHLAIKDLNMYLTTKKPAVSTETILLSSFTDTSYLAREEEHLNFQRQEKNKLLEAATSSLKESKNLHDKLEDIYHDCIDFSSVDAYCEKKIGEIFI